ncbi:sensor histidine kinase [Oligoflexus tunisiensis]|uniref:sensor histidine kinase n=1 Tax=Oligoflexus tunisiensis TaxID=708132 RepID=UPI001FE0B390|nr:HAMP domain-containing sensor histidine kinase [Oligoflexus tunisiensis]
MEGEINLSAEEKAIIESSINMGIREAVTAFALVQNNIREQFIATLSHDMRQPLNTISMAAQMLPEEPVDDDGFDARTMILNAVRKADALIQNLLDATLIKTGQRLQLEFSECDMRQIIDESVKEHALDQKARIEVHGESVIGQWSPRELERAIDNLITNAIKYGDLSQPIRINLTEYSGRVMVSVHNEGKPIPADEQETIFQAFRRSQAVQKGDKKGWGLGLPLVRGIVEAHAGSVHVDSSEGRGTTFIIDMPKDARPYQNAPVLH